MSLRLLAFASDPAGASSRHESDTCMSSLATWQVAYPVPDAALW
jgi:hypothetical protein